MNIITENNNLTNNDEINSILNQNIEKMFQSQEILEIQEEKINNISSNISYLEKLNSLSRNYLKRLGSLYYRFFNSSVKPIDNEKFRFVKTENLEDKYKDLNIMPLEKKIEILKKGAFNIGNTLNRQNNLLEDNNLCLDICLEDIKKNNSTIREL
jgi:hypothetical protein